MWLCNSSIGRKVIMSVTGMALILFLTFHGCMNVVALISAKGYNMICEFLGANWYAVAATVLLMALIFIHIVYAFILTLQNRKARGNNSYAVTAKPDKVEWSSQNMLVLGIIVLLGLCLHLYNFWYNMMFAELAGIETCPAPADGFGWIAKTFCCGSTCGIIYTVLYVIWIVAIWFHLTHGFWSALQTVGWSGHIWFKRWKVIGTIYITLVMAMFLAVIIGFASGLAPSLKDYKKGCGAQTELCEGGHQCNMAQSCDQANPECCAEGAECCVEGAECCAEAENACPGCGKETPCCKEGKACEYCDAQNGECCKKE